MLPNIFSKALLPHRKMDGYVLILILVPLIYSKKLKSPFTADWNVQQIMLSSSSPCLDIIILRHENQQGCHTWLLTYISALQFKSLSQFNWKFFRSLKTCRVKTCSIRTIDKSLSYRSSQTGGNQTFRRAGD